MAHTSSAGGIVINLRGEILVVEQANSVWSLPKGHIDPGEDALMAAKREIYEEAGVSPECLTLITELPSYKRYKIGWDGQDDHSELKEITFFVFRCSSMAVKPIDPAHPVAKWVSKSKVITLLTHPKDKAFFSEHQSRL
ncbi:NUDIX domain-containing protein [bacterium]|jgi:8-oxo-dGTP pyrophosphatase MutT (NUDIX family)|nr:NUDIX domain-containing protein [bacterium]